MMEDGLLSCWNAFGGLLDADAGAKEAMPIAKDV